MKKKQSFLSFLLVFMIIPAVIAMGIFVLDDRRYYIISLLVIGCAMVPFFMMFEKRRPQARELIVIAVMAALAVAGRAAFAFVPQVKPALAIIIIAGVCLGSQAGFLTGAVCGFVSNFFFGQGPWTPWQMFSFGIIGFLAGTLFEEGRLPKTKEVLSAFGGICAFLIYGGIINIGAVMMYMPRFSWEALMASYISAVAFDLIHGVSTAVFLFLLAEPMIEKLERIKSKYGLLRN
jgi:energy-coupling factor transport system substrate-specific component